MVERWAPVAHSQRLPALQPLHGARVPSSCCPGQRLQAGAWAPEEGQSYPGLLDNWALEDARLPC